MSKSQYILAIDQGTTGSRAILYDRTGSIKASAYQEFRQYYPKPGWVEHDALEIWTSVCHVIKNTIQKSKINSNQIASIGITNQRETLVVWDKKTSMPVKRAIVWQDRRTTELCEALKRRGLERKVRQKTGLVLDPYFSGSKLTWFLKTYPKLASQAKSGKVLCGTIDSWLLWKLSGGKSHATDTSNASRTLLYNIHIKKWDADLLRLFKVPRVILPTVKASGDLFGHTVKTAGLRSGIPVHAILGDQQAALYGQACYTKGQAKNTYGTGCFVVMNIGKKKPKVPEGLLVTLACDLEGKPVYALEGSIFIAGAAVQWLRDGLAFFKKASETEKLIKGLKDNGGVTVIPAFSGLGSPYWNAHVRGVISGITRGTTRAHIIRATLESIAHQSSDVIDQMKSKASVSLRELKVDGGATQNRFLMQTQANFLKIPVVVSDIQESTAWGVAKLAGKSCGIWTNLKKMDQKRKFKRYSPRLKAQEVKQKRESWKEEIGRLIK